MHLVPPSPERRSPRVTSAPAWRPATRSLPFSRPGLAAVAVRALALTTAIVAAGSFVPVAHAQAAATGEIRGRVQNAVTGDNLNNARVRVTGTTLEAFTGVNGEFRISGVPAGTANLDVFYTGMAIEHVPVSVSAGATAAPTITLHEAGAQVAADGTVKLNQFVVESQRETDAAAIAINEQRFAANRKDVISTDAYGDINQGNIGEFVKFIPGISLDVKDGNTPSGIMIRGFDPNYTTVTMDGGSLASTQIANTQTSSRGFLLDQASINNFARIEVTKVPTPDQSFNSLGGSVNFVSKSAFEHTRQQVTFNAFLSGNSSDLSFNQSPGPGKDDSYKIRPNFDITWINPVTRNFGYVFTIQDSSQYYLQLKSVPGRRYTSGGASLTNPQTVSMATSYNPNQVDRQSASLKLDYRPWDNNVFSLTTDATANRQQNASRTMTYNVGAGVPVSWDEHDTFGSTGATGTGTANEGNSYQNRNGLLRHVQGTWTFTPHDWTVEVIANYSNSNNRVRDTAKGFWNGLSTSLPNVKTVNLQNMDNSSAFIPNATVLDASGKQINELSASSYLLGKVTSQPATNTDISKEARLNVTRNFDLFEIPFSIKTGGLINDYTRDQHYSLWETTYAGPNGILGDGDESAAPFADSNTISTGFGRPQQQFLNPYLVYQAFQQHPNWFVRAPGNLGDTIKNEATRSPFLHERIDAGYAMLDTRLIHNRWRITSGVRYEYTRDEGWGYKQDANAIYVQDASGHPIKNAAGAYTLLPSLAGTVSGGPEQNALIYQYRAAHAARGYGTYYPSLNSTFDITSNLLFRFGYAETFGRPNVSDIVPNLFVSDNVSFGNGTSAGLYPGSISSSNTTLKPWVAKNYDYSLEYYLPHNGLISFDFYKKDIYNFFSTVNTVADIPLLDTLGLSHDLVGYQYTTRVNISNAMIKGWEANINLPLANLATHGALEGLNPILSHFTVGFNTTHIGLYGSRVTASDWKRFIPRSRNYSLRAQWGRFSGNALLNWRGKMLRDTSSDFPGASEYIRARYQLDGNLDYQVTKHFSAYIAARNLTNASSEWEHSGPGPVPYDFMVNYERYGVQYSLGMRGNF